LLATETERSFVTKTEIKLMGSTAFIVDRKDRQEDEKHLQP